MTTSGMMPEESTTPDQFEIRRRVFQGASRGDVDEALSHWPLAPDAIWDDSALGLGSHEGLAAIRHHMEDWIGSYDEFEMVGEELHDLGNVVTFGVNFQKGRPTGSTGYVQLRYAAVTEWVEGRIKRFTIYTDIDEARAAAERLAESTNPNLVERVSAFFEAANRRDVEARMSLFARETAWDLSPMGMGTFEGRGAIRRFLEDWRSSFEEVWWTLEEVVDLGNGVVLAVTRQDALLADGGARCGKCGSTFSHG